MKDFIIKHPIITFLIVDSVCVTIQNCFFVAVGHKPDTNTVLTRAGHALDSGIKTAKEEVEKVKKVKERETVELGFH